MGRATDDLARERERQAWEMRTRKGWSTYRIAAELGVEQPAVSKMLKRVGMAIHKEMAATIEAQKVEQSMQLDTVFEEALEAWERSKEDAEKSTTKRKAVGVSKEEQEPQGHGGSLKRNRMDLPPLEEFDPENIPGLYVDENGEDVSPEVRAAKIALAAAEWKEKQLSANRPLMVVEEVTSEESKGQVGDPRFLMAANKALDAKRELWGLNAPKPDGAGPTVIIKAYQGVDVAKEI